MALKPKKDEIYFNYPIPRSLHRKIRQFGLDHDMSVKDIVIQALLAYVSGKNDEKDKSDDL